MVEHLAKLYGFLLRRIAQAWKDLLAQWGVQWSVVAEVQSSASTVFIELCRHVPSSFVRTGKVPPGLKEMAVDLVQLYVQALEASYAEWKKTGLDFTASQVKAGADNLFIQLCRNYLDVVEDLPYQVRKEVEVEV
ncbi:MAG: hypothetical protein KatS3mg022_3575 [Armatimonadota bacterium]|nr:MAG: hypothetical protein KatS3mg022_3575 [Armatimonadota bacterium]GIV20507.1 MAG: hypothetical protein KatS3mg023_2258 [Armatimonadota bacterium]GIV22091.1 MAG: hypothetical protein KatS3mg023_3842 [Armatimonadota bacterium]